MNKHFTIFLACLALLAAPILRAGLFDKPKDNQDAEQRITAYMQENHDDILKVYGTGGAWSNWSDLDKASLAGKKVYVISHGLNDNHDAQWIQTTAQEIKNKDPNAIILTVNWDHFSGTKDDKNFGASTWINGASTLVAKKLQEAGNLKIEAAIGHSYGAHLLANVTAIAQSTGDTKVNRLIALDPAEETLTWTGDAKGEKTPMWAGNKKSKNWGLNGNTVVETYKSSVVLGTEEQLGDYNFILAHEGTFSPRSVLGDWGGFNKPTSMHSVPTKWISEMIASTGEVGGWFDAEVDKAAQNGGVSKGKGKYQGIVNADAKREDALGTLTIATGNWGDAVAEYALNCKDWENTVLNPKAKDGFQRKYHDDYMETLRQKGAKDQARNNPTTTTPATGLSGGGSPGTATTVSGGASASKGGSSASRGGSSTSGGSSAAGRDSAAKTGMDTANPAKSDGGNSRSTTTKQESTSDRTPDWECDGPPIKGKGTASTTPAETAQNAADASATGTNDGQPAASGTPASAPTPASAGTTTPANHTTTAPPTCHPGPPQTLPPLLRATAQNPPLRPLLPPRMANPPLAAPPPTTRPSRKNAKRCWRKRKGGTPRSRPPNAPPMPIRPNTIRPRNSTPTGILRTKSLSRRCRKCRAATSMPSWSP